MELGRVQVKVILITTASAEVPLAGTIALPC